LQDYLFSGFSATENKNDNKISFNNFRYDKLRYAYNDRLNMTN